MKTDYSNVSFRNDGRLRLLIVVGTRPEIIRLSAVITKCRKYFDCILAHTGQNYDYNLNEVFFRDLRLAAPEVYMDLGLYTAFLDGFLRETHSFLTDEELRLLPESAAVITYEQALRFLEV